MRRRDVSDSDRSGSDSEDGQRRRQKNHPRHQEGPLSPATTSSGSGASPLILKTANQMLAHSSPSGTGSTAIGHFGGVAVLDNGMQRYGPFAQRYDVNAPSSLLTNYGIIGHTRAVHPEHEAKPIATEGRNFFLNVLQCIAPYLDQFKTDFSYFAAIGPRQECCRAPDFVDLVRHYVVHSLKHPAHRTLFMSQRTSIWEQRRMSGSLEDSDASALFSPLSSGGGGSNAHRRRSTAASIPLPPVGDSDHEMSSLQRFVTKRLSLDGRVPKIPMYSDLVVDRLGSLSPLKFLATRLKAKAREEEELRRKGGLKNQGIAGGGDMFSFNYAGTGAAETDADREKRQRRNRKKSLGFPQQRSLPRLSISFGEDVSDEDDDDYDEGRGGKDQRGLSRVSSTRSFPEEEDDADSAEEEEGNQLNSHDDPKSHEKALLFGPGAGEQPSDFVRVARSRRLLTDCLWRLFRALDVEDSQAITWPQFSDAAADAAAKGPVTPIHEVINVYEALPQLPRRSRAVHRLTPLPNWGPTRFGIPTQGVFKIHGQPESVVEIYDAEVGWSKPVNQVWCHSSVVGFEFLPTFRCLLVSSADLMMRIYDIRSDREPALTEFCAEDTFSVMKWAPRWEKLYCAGTTGAISSWSIPPNILRSASNRFRRLTNDRYHQSSVTSLSFLPRDGGIVSASMDPLLIIQEPTRGEVIANFIGHKAAIRDVSYNEDFHFLASCGFDSEVHIWSMHGVGPNGGNCKPILLKDKEEPHTPPIVGVSCVEGTPQILSVDKTGLFKVWDIRTFHCVQNLYLDGRRLIQHGSREKDYNGMQYVKSKGQVVCYSQKHLRVAEYTNRQKDHDAARAEDVFVGVQYSNSGGTVITATQVAMQTWELQSGVKSGDFVLNLSIEVTAIAIDLAGRKVLVGFRNGTVSYYSAENGAWFRTIECGNQEIIDLATHANHGVAFGVDGVGTVYGFADRNDSLPLTELEKGQHARFLRVSDACRILLVFHHSFQVNMYSLRPIKGDVPVLHGTFTVWWPAPGEVSLNPIGTNSTYKSETLKLLKEKAASVAGRLSHSNPPPATTTPGTPGGGASLPPTPSNSRGAPAIGLNSGRSTPSTGTLTSLLPPGLLTPTKGPVDHQRHGDDLNRTVSSLNATAVPSQARVISPEKERTPPTATNSLSPAKMTSKLWSGSGLRGYAKAIALATQQKQDQERKREEEERKKLSEFAALTDAFADIDIGQGGEVNCACFAGDLPFVICCDSKGYLTIWTVAPHRQPMHCVARWTIVSHWELSTVSWSSKFNLLFTGDAGGTLCCYDLSSLRKNCTSRELRRIRDMAHASFASGSNLKGSGRGRRQGSPTSNFATNNSSSQLERSTLSPSQEVRASKARAQLEESTLSSQPSEQAETVDVKDDPFPAKKRRRSTRRSTVGFTSTTDLPETAFLESDDDSASDGPSSESETDSPGRAGGAVGAGVSTSPRGGTSPKAPTSTSSESTFFINDPKIHMLLVSEANIRQAMSNAEDATGSASKASTRIASVLLVEGLNLICCHTCDRQVHVFPYSLGRNGAFGYLSLDRSNYQMKKAAVEVAETLKGLIAAASVPGRFVRLEEKKEDGQTGSATKLELGTSSTIPVGSFAKSPLVTPRRGLPPMSPGREKEEPAGAGGIFLHTAVEVPQSVGDGANRSQTPKTTNRRQRAMTEAGGIASAVGSLSSLSSRPPAGELTPFSGAGAAGNDAGLTAPPAVVLDPHFKSPGSFSLPPSVELMLPAGVTNSSFLSTGDALTHPSESSSRRVSTNSTEEKEKLLKVVDTYRNVQRTSSILKRHLRESSPTHGSSSSNLGSRENSPSARRATAAPEGESSLIHVIVSGGGLPAPATPPSATKDPKSAGVKPAPALIRRKSEDGSKTDEESTNPEGLHVEIGGEGEDEGSHLGRNAQQMSHCHTQLAQPVAPTVEPEPLGKPTVKPPTRVDSAQRRANDKYKPPKAKKDLNSRQRREVTRKQVESMWKAIAEKSEVAELPRLSPATVIPPTSVSDALQYDIVKSQALAKEQQRLEEEQRRLMQMIEMQLPPMNPESVEALIPTKSYGGSVERLQKRREEILKKASAPSPSATFNVDPALDSAIVSSMEKVFEVMKSPPPPQRGTSSSTPKPPTANEGRPSPSSHLSLSPTPAGSSALPSATPKLRTPTVADETPSPSPQLLSKLGVGPAPVAVRVLTPNGWASFLNQGMPQSEHCASEVDDGSGGISSSLRPGLLPAMRAPTTRSMTPVAVTRSSPFLDARWKGANARSSTPNPAHPHETHHHAWGKSSRLRVNIGIGGDWVQHQQLPNDGVNVQAVGTPQTPATENRHRGSGGPPFTEETLRLNTFKAHHGGASPLFIPEPKLKAKTTKR